MKRLLALLLISGAAHAGEPDLLAGAGATVLRGEMAAIDLTLRYRHADFDYEVGGTLIGPTDHEGVTQRTQLAIHLAYIRRFGRFSFGMGPAYLNSIDTYNGSHFNMKLLAGWEFDHWSVRWLHFSNAGSSDVNKGRDMLLATRTL